MVQIPTVYIPTHITGIHKLHMNPTKLRSNSAVTEVCCKAFPDFSGAEQGSCIPFWLYLI